MSKYTTGEIAKKCKVSVRTVQYYDTRGILVPSELSEGGRRLYSEGDLEKMKIICFLRELELPIDTIKHLLSQEHPENVISMILEEQETQIRREIAQKQDRVNRISQIKKAMGQIPGFTMDSINDIAHIMENKKQLRRLHVKMLVVGLPMEVIELATIILWIVEGIWWPYVLGLLAQICVGTYISVLYYNNTVFICPECHGIFRPKALESLFAWHTPYTRKLTCTHCGHNGFCVETYGKGEHYAEN